MEDDLHSISQRSSMYFSDTESALGDSASVAGASAAPPMGTASGSSSSATKTGSDIDSLYR